jgi:hypothetical protein
MADQLKLGSTKGTTTRPASQTAPISREPKPSIGTDTLTSSGTGSASAPSKLSNQDQEGLNSLTNGVRQIVLTYGIQDGQVDTAKEKQIKQNLTDEIHKLVPGGLYLTADKDAEWNIRDLTNLYNIVSSMSPGDRSALAGVTFMRSHQAAAAEGASEAVKQQYGRDAAQLMDEIGAGGESHVNEEPVKKQGWFSRVWGSIKGAFVHAVEGVEGFFNIRLLSDKTRAQFDGKPQRTVVLTDTGSNLLVSNRIWAHEIGHQLQLSDGRWNPERIREFSKFSGWTETYPDGRKETFDGIDDRTGRRMLFNEKIVKAARSDNFVSKYAKTDPGEDFAESYAFYLLNPGLLLEKAPEKFLFINAQSKKYGASQVQEFAGKAKVDLTAVATKLVQAGELKQETLNDILSTHGLRPDSAAVMATDPVAEAKSPLMAAWGKIMAKVQAEPEAYNQVVEDPKSAVGGMIWNSLTDQDRWALGNKDFMHKMVGSLGKGFASQKSVFNATVLQEQRSATDKALNLLLNDSVWRNQLIADPAKTLEVSGLTKALPPDVVKALTSEDNRDALKEMVKRVNALAKDESQWDKYQDNLKRLASQMGPEHFAAFVESLNDSKNEDQAAKVIENAIKTGNLIFPGDGQSQPGG